MSDPTASDNAIPGLRAGATYLESGAGPVTRLVRAITPDLAVLAPDLRLDPRAALRDMRIKGKLRTDLQELARSAGLSLEDDSADDPYADANGKTLKRQFSLLKSATDEVVLLQIEDWIANDGANVGAMDEVRDAFSSRKVRIIAEKVLTPSLSLDKTMPRIWREKAKIDLEFVSWRFVLEVLEGKLTLSLAFGLGAALADSAKPPGKKSIKRVFIGSTGLDLRDYRDAAGEVCLGSDLFPVMMEQFEVMGAGATAGSKRKLDSADLYVGIFAHRYGFIEDGQTASVTEIEFDYAGERKIDRLCFMVDPKLAWPPEHVDHEHYKQLDAFKKRIEKTLIRGQFTTVDNFREQLTRALMPYRP